MKTLALITLLTLTSFAQTTAFTYQGKLTDAGSPANGNYDLQFKLFDALSGGTQQGGTLTNPTVTASAGIFTVSLDFGANVFSGANRFLEIGVRPAGSVNPYTVLVPRQPITSTPYAIQTLKTASADALSSACVACVQDAQINAVAGSKVTGMLPVASIPAGSTNYIQNGATAQAASNFNISGNGTAGGTFSGNVVNATTQFNLGGNRLLSASGAGNVFLGMGTGNTGVFNTFVGANVGTSNTSGQQNSFVGNNAGPSITTGTGNSFFGFDTGGANNQGNFNTFLGQEAGSSTTMGSTNVFVGVSAGESNVLGSDNVAIGVKSDVGSASLSNATVIGTRALVTQSNSLVLGSINGVNFATADTNVGIGTTAPRSALEITRNWNGSFGALTVTGDRPTIRFSGGAVANNQQWILHLGSTAGGVPAGSLSFFNGGTAGTAYGAPVLAVTPTGTVVVMNLGSAGGTQLCRNASNEIATCSSSLRYKNNVQPFLGGLDIINRLRPISFQWKQGGAADIGLGAEEVEQVEPRLTFRNANGQLEGVKYNQLSAVFINAFKQQQEQIEQQQSQIEDLKRLVCLDHPNADVCKTEARKP